MQAKSFEQWKRDNADLLAELEENPQDCESCDGDGQCQCLTCNDYHECGICHGTGKKSEDEAQKLYEKYLTADKQNLDRWTKEPIHATR